jgi:hypothetical protein
MKLWWVHCEALIATLMAYHVTGNTKYWDLFKKTMHYASTHVSALSVLHTTLFERKDVRGRFLVTSFAAV